MNRERPSRVPGAVALLIAAFFVYWPALDGGWLWDDNVDITDNRLLRDWRGLWQIWFAPTTLDYYPLKFTVQWIQWHLWGDNVTGYHVTNVALHALSGLLLWRVFARLGLRFAWLGALVFVVHPLAVESVAWIAELKNALALPPLLLALLAWFDFEAGGGRRDHRRALAWFLAAMLCKSAVVMFPVTLLVHTWWKRGRIAKSDTRALLPFFAISLVLGLVTVWLQNTRALDGGSPVPGGVLPRLALAGTSLASYAGKAVWPADLLPLYPPWRVEPPAPWQSAPWLVLTVLAAWSWRQRGTWGRHALLGGGWFLLHLLPFVGFVPISYMRFTWVMDHLAYFALPGVIGLALAGAQNLRWQKPIWIGGALTGLVLAGLARQNATRFRDARVFWEHAVAGNPDAWIARNNLGRAYAAAGEWTRALAEFQQASRLNPGQFEVQLNLGNTLRQLGRAEEGLPHLQTAVRMKPTVAAAHYNLGLSLDAEGRTEEAQACYQRALQLDPAFAAALITHGEQLGRAGRQADAQRVFASALRSNPDSVETHDHLARSLSATGRLAEALVHFETAVRLRPNAAEAHNNLGAALVAIGRPAEAVPAFTRAVELRSNFADARLNLGLVLVQLGRESEAVAQFEAVLRLEPGSLRAHFNLANALAAGGRLGEAIDHYERALQTGPNHSEIHVKLAETLATAGRKAEAGVRYAEARRLNPTLPAREF